MRNSQKKAEISGEEVLGRQRYLTVAEAAAYLRTRRENIYALIDKGYIPAFEPPFGKRLVRRADLDGVLKHHRWNPNLPCKHQEAVNARLAKLAAEKAAERAQEATA